MDLRDLKSYQVLKERNSSFLTQIDSIFNLTCETINGIARFYDNYTMHDMNHGLSTNARAKIAIAMKRAGFTSAT